MADFKFTPEQEAWLQKLESDEMQDKQARGCMRSEDGCMCCLGVYCSLQSDVGLQNSVFEYNGELMCAVPDQPLADRLGLRSRAGDLKVPFTIDGFNEPVRCLTSLNDEVGWTFKEIAAYIRSNPENVFVKGAE